MKLPFKIISRRKYNTEMTKAEMYLNMYNQSEENWAQNYQELEFKIEDIDIMIINLINDINTQISKDAIKKKLKNIRRFIEKGKM